MSERARNVVLSGKKLDFLPKLLSKTLYHSLVDSGCQLHEEHLVLNTEGGAQGDVPLLLLKQCNGGSQCTRESLPSVIFLHPTGEKKETMIPSMKKFALKGYLTVAIDCRYHGGRSTGDSDYQDALVHTWKTGEGRPFLFDNVYDIVKVVDYLITRPDVMASKIGITGVSLGGMHSWLASAIDDRICVSVPIIGVQCFKWAVELDEWLPRVKSIPLVFEAARKDLSKEKLDSEVVEKVWNRIAPGLLDALLPKNTLPMIAPRPLLILNGADDLRCPVEGIREAISVTSSKYEELGVTHSFKFVAVEGVGHSASKEMEDMMEDWFDRYLLSKSHGRL